ncbi:MAG: DNA mismatch repair protein MutL [Candidatus Kapaibacterium sp.]|nr:MAG: DNA mismatch repair protein MutL [Candidatus Kapabacteria bacterium]
MEQPQITVLPDHIANQIAAGEVVQRPESVVKELVENALDAGASSVAVFVREGGKALVHVLDDGSGMSRADLELALRRHATSKIRSLDDLRRLQTLGFRGEALASIASVADVEILTRRHSDAHGWRLLSSPLKSQRIEPAEAPPGTQVIVRNLFFTVPARRKFLRTDATELRYISETMIRYGLSYPDRSWKFHDGGGVVFDLVPQPLFERISALFGGEIAASLIPVDYQTDVIRIEGYIGLPTIARTTKASQYLFLNHRPIVSRALVHAIYQGYEHMLDKTEHPFFVLFLWLDPERVDVNVHPQKHEVKFDDERAMYHAVHEAVLQSMREHGLVPTLRVEGIEAAAPLVAVPSGAVTPPLVVNRLTGEIVPLQEQPLRRSPTQRSNQPTLRTERPAWQPARVEQLEQLLQPVSPPQQSLSIEQPRSRRLWQMHNKYIFVQTDDGIMIIDQHIAHERILYERALDAMERAAGDRSQRLMFPVTVQLTAAERAIYCELEDDLHRLGYESRLTADGASVELLAVPVEIRAGSEAASLREILEQYAEYQTIRPAAARDNLAASFGCRAAIKAGDPLTQEEMQQLIEDLFRCRTPEVCPHGRPVMIHFPLRELDRRFGRTS